MRERSFHLICLFSAVALSGCPRPTVSIPQQFLLAYQARDGGAIVVRSSLDGTTWVDFPAPGSPGATRVDGLLKAARPRVTSRRKSRRPG